MSDTKPMMQLKIDKAVAYTISKGRMPRDVYELREWLREYAEFEMKCYEAIREAFEQHMSTCTQPTLICFHEPKHTMARDKADE